MEALFTAVALSFGLVFVGEMGDKSQLMALTFATRYRLRSVILGMLIAIAALIGLSVGLGSALGTLLPTDWIRLAAAALFIGFGLWALRGEDEEEDGGDIRERRSGLLTVIGAMFLAELGDKTMIVSLTLGSQYNGWGVWIGGTAGMLAADLLAVFAGVWVARHIPERYIRWGSAAVFVLLGVVLGVEAVTALTA